MVLDFETIVRLTGTIGFPAVVCAYVLVRLNKSLEKMDSTIHKMALAIVEHNEKLAQIVTRRRDSDRPKNGGKEGTHGIG